MDLESVNITIKPTEKVTQQAIKVAHKIISHSDGYFAINTTQFFPHITLYATEYPSAHIQKLTSELDQHLKKFPAFEINFTTVHTQQGYIDIQLEKSSEIIELHTCVITIASKYRRKLTLLDRTTIKASPDFSQEQKHNIISYGFSDCHGLFRPHLTFTRLKDAKQAKKISSKIEWTIPSMKVDTIAAYKMGGHGTCTQPIQEFSLQQ